MPLSSSEGYFGLHLHGGHGPTDSHPTGSCFDGGRETSVHSQPDQHSDTYPTRYQQPATAVCGLEGSHDKDETRGVTGCYPIQ